MRFGPCDFELCLRVLMPLSVVRGCSDTFSICPCPFQHSALPVHMEVVTGMSHVCGTHLSGMSPACAYAIDITHSRASWVVQLPSERGIGIRALAAPEIGRGPWLRAPQRGSMGAEAVLGGPGPLALSAQGTWCQSLLPSAILHQCIIHALVWHSVPALISF
jgi:hypothetical protein